MGRRLSIAVNPNTYLRNPEDTELGRKIIKHGVELLSETGYQCFNFKHLAKYMESTEASVYRYFENKYMLLVYLTSWYWEYLDLQIMLNTRNIDDPHKKLRLMVKTIVSGVDSDFQNEYFDIKKLHKIVVEQSPRVIHSKKVEACEKAGMFSNFKTLNNNIAEIILECDNDFKYPSALATNILKLSMDHKYYSEYICSLTEISNCSESLNQLEEMILYFLNRLLQLSK